MNNIVQTIINGSTYNGSVLHCLINYATLLFSILPYLFPRNEITPRRIWLYAFLTAVFIQILLWFSIHAIGISIIWAAMSGFNAIMFYIKKKQLHVGIRLLFGFGLFIALFVIIFYADILPPVTTVAHLIGVLIGGALYYLYSNLVKQ